MVGMEQVGSDKVHVIGGLSDTTPVATSSFPSGSYTSRDVARQPRVKIGHRIAAEYSGTHVMGLISAWLVIVDV
jgi:hypothetical protein